MDKPLVPVNAPIWTDLMSSDPEGAKDFYGKVFGWKAEIRSEFGYTIFKKDGKMVAGMGKNDNDDPLSGPDRWMVSIYTKNINDDLKKVKENKGTVFSDVMEVGEQGKLAFVSDASAALFGLWEPIDHNGFEIMQGGQGTPAWFEVITQDYKADVDFYSNTFNWEAKKLSDSEEFQYTQASLGGTNIAGIMNAEGHFPPEMPSMWQVYFVAEDLDETLKTAQTAGGEQAGEIVKTPFGRTVAIKDPTNAVFNLAGK